MPTNKIQSDISVTSLDANAPNVASLKHDQTADVLRYQSPNAGSASTLVTLPKYIPVSIVINGAGSTTVDGPVWIADDAYQLVSFKTVVSTSGGLGATVMPRKCTGTVAPASGTVLVQTAVDLVATVNVVQTGQLVATTASLQFAAGDRLALDYTSTVSAVVGCVTALFKRL